MNKQHISEITKNHRGELGEIISTLEDIQNKYSYLSEEALSIVAQNTGRSLVDIYGVATFYRFFSLEPRGKHLVSVCLGTACHVRGSPGIVAEFTQQLGIKPGKTTADKEITLETVNCLGACALGPTVVVDGHYFSNVKREEVKEIIRKTRVGLDRIDIKRDKRVFPVDVSCPHCNHSLMDQKKCVDGYPSIRVTLSFGDKHGWLRLSCLYGSYSIESEYRVPTDAVANFFCPHCHAYLNGVSKCMECGAPMMLMIVRGGGVLQVCSRHGCKGHILDLG